jgi:hypothetical protein
VVTQLRNLLGKPGEDIRVVYIHGSTGGPNPGMAGAVFVRLKAGRPWVIGLGQADPPSVVPKEKAPPAI